MFDDCWMVWWLAKLDSLVKPVSSSPVPKAQNMNLSSTVPILSVGEQLNSATIDYGVNPIASYITLAIVLVFLTALFLSRMIITIEKPKNDLAIFNSQRNKNLKPLISKHTSNQAALNNTRLAISLGLMQALDVHATTSGIAATDDEPTGGGGRFKHSKF